MAFKDRYRGWVVANSSKREIRKLIYIVLCLLATWELTFLGWHNDEEEIILSIWFDHN
jgi:hypothetical protein